MSYPYSGVDLRKHTQAYEIGRGEQGVFHAEPYKSELLPLWSFKDAKVAKKAADDIYGRFLDYKAEGDFVGMDVARKYLQMGYTRSRRYANYEGGNKSKPLARLDPEKSRAAEIFYREWRKAAEDEEYLKLKKQQKSDSREHLGFGLDMRIVLDVRAHKKLLRCLHTAMGAGLSSASSSRFAGKM